MGKVQVDFNKLRYPLPITLVGATVKGKPNFLTIGYFAILSHLPPIVSVSLYKNHYTVKGIKENGAFSVNFPSADMVEITEIGDNDRVYVYSDGITETENSVQEMFGQQRLESIFAQNTDPDNLFIELQHALDAFRADTEQSDDITLAEIRFDIEGTSR